MVDLSFYRMAYGITSPEGAFEEFVGKLQNYYDANYYVDWGKVSEKIRPHRRELLLLSSLCEEPDKERAARELLRDYPKVIKALPILMACRGNIKMVEDTEEARVTTYNFRHVDSQLSEAEVERYVNFMCTSGLLALLSEIKSVLDYATGVEVGMDTNARKNRGGHCGTKAILPFISQAQQRLPGLRVKFEAGYDFLSAQKCVLPDKFRHVIWDVAFWTNEASPHLVVAEINHYGSSGGKPPAIAREYIARQADLDAAGVGFIWVTDGCGWRHMLNPLREAFNHIPYLINIKLAKDGYLEWALRQSLFGPRTRQEMTGEPVYTSR